MAPHYIKCPNCEEPLIEKNDRTLVILLAHECSAITVKEPGPYRVTK